MYQKYRIIKRKLINDSFVYVVQVEGYITGGWVGQQYVGALQQHAQGAVWSDISTHTTLELAKQFKHNLETGLKVGEEVVG